MDIAEFQRMLLKSAILGAAEAQRDFNDASKSTSERTNERAAANPVPTSPPALTGNKDTDLKNLHEATARYGTYARGYDGSVSSDANPENMSNATANNFSRGNKYVEDFNKLYQDKYLAQPSEAEAKLASDTQARKDALAKAKAEAEALKNAGAKKDAPAVAGTNAGAKKDAPAVSVTNAAGQQNTADAFSSSQNKDISKALNENTSYVKEDAKKVMNAAYRPMDEEHATIVPDRTTSGIGRLWNSVKDAFHVGLNETRNDVTQGLIRSGVAGWTHADINNQFNDLRAGLERAPVEATVRKALNARSALAHAGNMKPEDRVKFENDYKGLWSVKGVELSRMDPSQKSLVESYQKTWKPDQYSQPAPAEAVQSPVQSNQSMKGS